MIDRAVADRAVAVVRDGDDASLHVLLVAHPGLASARLPGQGSRTLLHVATDWPGGFPRVAETIAALVSHGADPNAAFQGDHAETPLHWAASSGDVAALDALLDAGADIEAPGAVIAGGTPMADATAFGQWDAARRLLERGARTSLFEAAALGLVDRVSDMIASGGLPPDALTSALWGACHGGQRSTAELLLAHGADADWVGYDGLTPIGAAKRAGADDLVAWLVGRGRTT